MDELQNILFTKYHNTNSSLVGVVCSMVVIYLFISI